MITWFSWLRNRQRKLRISFGMHSHSMGARWGTKMFSPIPCMCNLAERTVRTDSTSTACNNVLYRERDFYYIYQVKTPRLYLVATALIAKWLLSWSSTRSATWLASWRGRLPKAANVSSRNLMKHAFMEWRRHHHHHSRCQRAAWWPHLLNIKKLPIIDLKIS